jgi:ribosomal protein S18 acetylase RimI-like enzyme
MKTLNKHTKWRKDSQAIFICDCKRLIDLKIDLKYEDFMKRLNKGVSEKELSEEDKIVLEDFKKMKLLSELKIDQISKEGFEYAMKLLDNELGKDRVRDSDFLKDKYSDFSQFFIGALLDKELIGFICGFPREDYLLLSEIVVDSKFKGRGIGEKLVLAFEKVSKEYKKIKVGARDSAIGFYYSLVYKPFLLAQGKFSQDDLCEFQVNKKGEGFAEIKIDSASIGLLEKLRKKYPKIDFQYIFQKTL